MNIDPFKRLVEGVQKDAAEFNLVNEEKTTAPNDADVKSIAAKSKAKSNSTDKQTADKPGEAKTNEPDGKVKSEDGIPAQGGVPEVKAQADSKITKESVEEVKIEEKVDEGLTPEDALDILEVEKKEETTEVVEKKAQEKVDEAGEGDKETYTWAQINQALMNKGIAAARIADILSALSKVKAGK